MTAWELPNGAKLGELERGVAGHRPVVLSSPRDGAQLGVLELATGSAVLHTLPLRRSAAPAALRFDLSAWFGDPPTFKREWVGDVRTRRAVPVVDPTGTWFALAVGRQIVLQPLEGGAPARVLARHEAPIWWLQSSPDGSLVAACDVTGGLRLWSVATGEGARLDGGTGTYYRTFSADGASFITCSEPTVEGSRTLRVWRLGQGSPVPGRSTVLGEGAVSYGDSTGLLRSDRRARWVTAPHNSRGSSLWNLGWPADAAPVTLRFGTNSGTTAVSVHPEGTWVAASYARGTAIWPLRERAAQALVGHRGAIMGLAFAPDDSWLASTSTDMDLRLWPVPDLSRPPAHTLPLEELLAKLKAQTNLRAVADPAAPGGYRLVLDPFPGWATVPEW